MQCDNVRLCRSTHCQKISFIYFYFKKHVLKFILLIFEVKQNNTKVSNYVNNCSIIFYFLRTPRNNFQMFNYFISNINKIKLIFIYLFLLNFLSIKYETYL